MWSSRNPTVYGLTKKPMVTLMTMIAEPEKRTEAAPRSEDIYAKLESSILAWKANVTDAHVGLTRQLAQTNELLDCLLRAFSERRSQAQEIEAARAEIQALKDALAERDTAIAAGTARTAKLDQVMAAFQAELAAARGREAQAGAEVKRLGEEVSALRAAAAEQGPALEESRAVIEDLRQALNDRERLAESVAELQQALETERREYAASRERIEQREVEFSRQIAAAHRAREQAEEERDRLRVEVEVLRHTNAVLVAEAGVSRPVANESVTLRTYDESGNKLRLGEILAEAGYLTKAQLADAVTEQETLRQTRLGTILIGKGFVAEEAVARGVACQLRAAS